MSLLLWYKLNDNAASTAIVDSSGNGKTGTAPRNTNLDAVAGVVNLGHQVPNTTYNTTPVVPTAAGSIVVWAKWTSVIASRGIVHAQNGTGRCYLTLDASKQISGGIGSQSYITIYTSTVPVAGTWYHIAITWSAADGVRLYVNGVQGYSGAMAGNVATSAFSFSGLVDYLDGILGVEDDLRIYSHVLPAYQIAALYNFGKGSEDAEPWRGDLTIRPVVKRAVRPILCGAA